MSREALQLHRKAYRPRADSAEGLLVFSTKMVCGSTQIA